MALATKTARPQADRQGVIRVIRPEDRPYYDVNDVMKLLGVKHTKAYDLINKCRKELIDTDRLISDYPAGRVPKKYFNQRCAIED